MSEVNINLDGTTKVNYRNLRHRNAFDIKMDIAVNGVPIDATDYTFTLTFYNVGKSVLVVADSDFTKTGDRIERSWDSFPLAVGAYTFDLTVVDSNDKVVTFIPGTLTIIPANA